MTPIFLIIIIVVIIIIITVTVIDKSTITNRYGGEGAEAMMGFFTELLSIAKQQNLNQVNHLFAF